MNDMNDDFVASLLEATAKLQKAGLSNAMILDRLQTALRELARPPSACMQVP